VMPPYVMQPQDLNHLTSAIGQVLSQALLTKAASGGGR
jgi:adenosylmethionine-8-amino-7-oxononanoate aminotransferase